MKENLYFYFTNDFHSYFKHWPHVAHYFKQVRKNHELKEDSFWFADIGDHMDRAHPLSEAFLGKINVQLLNRLGYDIATIGNNEGITISYDELFHLYDDADFSLVCSNLTGLKSRQPDWLQESKIITSKLGAKIGIIGLTPPFNPYYHPLGWHIENPLKVLEEILPKLKKTTDIIILLSHLGIHNDREIAQQYPDIDMIFGGHTHHLLPQGEQIGSTLLAAAGKHCEHIGKAHIVFDHERKQVVSKEAQTVRVIDQPQDEKTADWLKVYEKKARAILNEPVITTDQNIEVNTFKTTHVMEAFTQTLLEWTNADVAMLNGGLLLDSLSNGTVTYGDVHRICPHPINPVVVKLSGQELLEVIRVTHTEEWMHTHLEGFGFRGTVLGKAVYAGLHIETDKHPNGQYIIKHVTQNGLPIDNEQEYTFATGDLFTFGRLIPEVAKSTYKKLYLPEFLRELLVVTLRHHF